MQIQPHFQTIGALFTGRLFRIPEYQRAYSWHSKHRQDLFSDIKKVFDQTKRTNGRDASHFMATVVGLRRGKKAVEADEFLEIEVVDGQQRLTTLTILLKAISKELGDGRGEANCKEEIENLLIKRDELSLLVLQTNHDSTNIFTDYIRSGSWPKKKTVVTAADQNLITAIEECESFVAEWRKASNGLVDLYATIKNRISVIFHEIEDEGLVYTVFEVLNSRGLDVTWFDKLKSLLMAIVFEHGQPGTKTETIRELHNLWTEIYRTIGLERLDRETVRFAGTLRLTSALGELAARETRRSNSVPPNKLLDEESGVIVLASGCGNNPRKVVECTKWLLKVTQAESRLLGDVRIAAATHVVQARFVGTAILLREFSEADERLLMRRWENVTFRIYGLGRKDSRTKVGDYVRLAWQILNENLASDSILAKLDEIGREYPIERVIEGLTQNCYESWAEQLRYFLFRYEEHLAKRNGSSINEAMWRRIWSQEPSKSIEHIRPSSKGPWEPSKRNIFVHRLGNLTILLPGVNSKLQDKSPKRKVVDYKNTGLLITMDVARLIEKNDWRLRTVEKREERMINWARKEWGS